MSEPKNIPAFFWYTLSVCALILSGTVSFIAVRASHVKISYENKIIEFERMRLSEDAGRVEEIVQSFQEVVEPVPTEAIENMEETEEEVYLMPDDSEREGMSTFDEEEYASDEASEAAEMEREVKFQELLARQEEIFYESGSPEPIKDDPPISRRRFSPDQTAQQMPLLPKYQEELKEIRERSSMIRQQQEQFLQKR